MIAQVAIRFEEYVCKDCQRKMALNFLNKKAAAKCRYQPFDDLEPGRYNVTKFFIKNDTKFKTGNRLCMKILEGTRYVILPKRFMDDWEGDEALEKLNAEPCVFVFEGKIGEFDIDFRFEEVKAQGDN